MLAMIFTASITQAQIVLVGSESFDGSTHTFTSTPGSAWMADNTYQVDGTKSIWGMVPNLAGDSIILTTPVYDCSSYGYVTMRFSHICKVSPMDQVQVQYRLNIAGTGGTWQDIPASVYEGSAANYAISGFNAASYSIWNAADSLALPTNGWWKEEIFDLSNLVSYDQVQFRFVIRKGNVSGTNISYGWLIDKFELAASIHELKSPEVSFISNFPDTVYYTGPYIIQAKVAKRTVVDLNTPNLIYTASHPTAGTVTDTLVMTAYQGDSLWQTTIPQYIFGSTINYSVRGEDSVGNYATATGGFVSAHSKAASTSGDSIQVGYSMTGGDCSYPFAPSCGTYNWSRHLYKGDTIFQMHGIQNNGSNASISISGIAFYTGYTPASGPYTRYNHRIYLMQTNDVNMTSGYVDPVTAGATLVYQGNITFHNGLNKIVFDQPFVLNPGYNLYFFNIDSSALNVCHSSSDRLHWAYNSQTYTCSDRHYEQLDCNNSSTTAATSSLPTTWFYLGGSITDSNSVAMYKIENPTTTGTIANQVQPVLVTFKNKGFANLTSAVLGWSLNGVLQDTIHWTGNLPDDFNDTITLGYYTQRASQFDTIKVWVNMPNGVLDTNYFDDTLTVISYGCESQFSGTYTVGKGNDFESLSDFVDVAKLCNPVGDITLEIESGTYVENWDMSSIGNIMGNHMLTITSKAHNADSVIVKPASGVALKLSNNKNLTIKDITFDCSHITAYTVQFTSACEDVIIRDCKILSSTTTTSSSSSAIYKASGTGILNRVSFINNYISGGYYGFYLYAGTGSAAASRGDDIVIDSNLIVDQYYYATYFYYGNFKVNGNTILSKTNAASTYWYGLRFYYCDINVQNNKIEQRTDAITYPYGIYAYYINQNTLSTDSALIANNTISIATTSSYYGMYLGYFNGEILHNTILVKGTTSGYGIFRTGVSGVSVFRVKNNIIRTIGISSYPIYLSTKFDATIDDIDANDLKGANYVGYAGKAHTSLATWGDSVLTDSHSVSVEPHFLTESCFDLTDSAGLLVNALAAVPNDIKGVNRGTITTMGAYHYYIKSNNATPVELYDIQSSYASNTSVPLKVVVRNDGSNTLTSLDINAEINGVLQQPYKWTGSLATGAIDTVTITTLQIADSYYQIKIYTSLPNGTADLQTENDTLNHLIVRCNGILSGTYTIGQGEDFEDLDLAFMAAKYCGINGSVQFALTEDIIVNSKTFQTVSGTSSSNPIVITTAVSKASLLANSSPVIMLHNVENIKFQNLNISDGTKGVVVKMAGICRNITFDGCNINGMPSSTNSNDRTIEVYNSSSDANGAFNIVFNNNVINGGYYNMYLYYISGTSGAMTKGNGWDITNNTFQNAYYYGIYDYYYGYFRKINNNTITSRSNSSGYYGVYLSYYNAVEEIMNNRINITATSTAYGISDYYYNNTSYGYTQPKLIANNEIIIKSTGSSYVYGIYACTTKVNIYNNSIYCYSNYSYGVYRATYSSSTYSINIVNNNILVNRYSGSTTTQYPLYINSTTYATSTYGTCDYNNYYNLTGSTTVASMGGTAYTLAQLKSYQNASSTNVNPSIANPLSILCQGANANLSCPRLAAVLTDITGDQRNATTAMGAYGEPLKNLDVALNKIKLDSKEDGVATSPVLFVINRSLTTKVSSFAYKVEYNGVTTTGQFIENMVFLKEYQITLPTFIPDTGVNNIKVYITSVNGAGLDSVRTNDTVSVTFTACSKIHGTYVVGSGAGADFANLTAFYNQIADCMVDGDIELQFQSGTYTTLDVTSAVTDAMGGHHLTINSVAKDSSAVKFTTSSVVLTLNGQSNLTIKNVTLNSTGNKTVQITGDCHNITFTHCAILSLPTTTSSTYACIYKASSTGLVENFNVNNCLLDGGYYGIYLYGGGSSAYNSGIIDSNIVSNQYYYAIYSYYGDITINHNSVISRTSSTTTYWYGIYSYYNNGDRIGNRILQRSNSITYPYGMYAYYHGTYLNPTNKDYLFANNEIDVYTTGAYYGMSIGYSRLNIVNNSVRVKGSGMGYGLYIPDASNNHLSIYNNNIDMESGYPIYITATSYINMIQSDYNNFSGPYFGYAAGAYMSQNAWQNALQLDSHSVAVPPVYANNTGLETSNYGNFFCPKHDSVSEDINGNNRMSRTVMGAYTPEVQDFDLAVIVLDYPNGIHSNASTNVAIKVINLGNTNITGANIGWRVNGVAQTPYTWTASPALPTFEDATINIGSFTTPASGFIKVEVWLTSVNSSTDDVQDNDTIVSNDYVCGGPLAGTYTVGGSNADFNTPEEMWSILNTCGIDSTVEFKIAAGTYNPLEMIGNVTGASDTNLIIITSATGNANDVKFVGNDALVLSGASHLRINNLTFDASAGSGVAVKLMGMITDVDFYACNMTASPTATTSTSAGVYYNNGSSTATTTLSNVKFIKNNISGGYYGMYLYYMGGANSNITSGLCNVTIDSNNITNFYCYGIYSYYYSRYKSISHNTFVSRAISATQYVLYLNYYNVIDSGIVGNKILLQSTSTSYGFYCYYINSSSYASYPALFANNEIRKLSGAGTSYGAYVYYPRIKMYNNSMLIKGTGTNYGIYHYSTSSSYSCDMRNNILATGSGYPIYCSSSTYVTSTYVTTDYNNYYSTAGTIGFTGVAQTTLAALRSATGQDAHSINVLPQWKDSTVDLDLANYIPFLSANVGGLATDIKGLSRTNTTIMGAYSTELYDGKDIKLESVEGFPETEDFCSASYSDIDFVITGNGTVKTEFNQTALTAHLSITGAVTFDTVVTINSGSMEIFDRTTISIVKNMDITPSGIYHITAWIACSADTNYVNDTISFDYIANKVALPMDETFENGLPLTMRVADNNTATGWEVLYDSNATGSVIPQTGNAMIAFDGSRGAMSRLYTRQLDLSGTSQPILDFWYWHDTAATVSTMDYTDVRLTFDGGQTFTTLFSVRKNNGNDMGWTQYTYSLDSFVNQSCVILVFESMRMSLPQFDGEQYIDRIKLTSNQDLSIEEMIVPELTPCDYTGKELSIVLGSLTAQNISFESYPTSLQVNITGATTQTYNIPLNSGIIPGMDYDTLVLDNDFDFNPGTYYIYAKIMTSIDKVATNDVLYDTIIVNPSIDVAATQVTGGNDNTNCIGIEGQVNQVVVFTNDGNMDMEDVILTLNVYDITGAKVQIIEDTLAGVFAVNQTTTYTFAEAYDVPEGAMYNVEVVASPMCNATLTYTDVITECVDQSDVEVTAFINPADDETCSSVGTNIKVKVRVSNNHPDEDIQGVVLNVVVSTNNTQIASWTETLSDISSDSYIDFEFPQGFNVPEEADYTIVAYVNSVDAKSSNDTLSITKCTDLGVIDQNANAMSLGQNIPNPAKAQTVVNYQVPTEGTVVFTLTTVTGQVIYTTAQEVEAGRNSVEFNTENLAAGIYFYTMDFNGQRLTKKMTIRR